MSGEVATVENICNCLASLTNEIHVANTSDSARNHADVTEAFTFELKRNVHLTFQKIENYNDVKSFVLEYIQPCNGENCVNCDYLKFLQLCLVLLRLLKNTLQYEVDSSSKQANNTTQVPKGILSISQKSTLQKCLQFTVALGLLPNLLRGIGIPLTKRLKHAVILEKFVSYSTLNQKHVQLAVCLDTLIECVACEAMQSTVLTYHGTDILAALLQLCYAPIKKLDISEASPKPVETDCMSFKLMLCSFHDCSNTSQSHIINIMLAHRKYFLPHLEEFFKQFNHSLLMWELLLFQGIPIKSSESEGALTKSPLWLRKICNQMLTDLILQNHGVADLIEVVLDKAYDADVDNGRIDKTRMEAVARLVACNPVKHISVSDYIKKLSRQVFSLLQVKGTPMDNLFKFIGSCLFFQFCERDKSAEQHLLVKLLKPLWCCVRLPDNLHNNVVLSEKELSTCIETLHEIFVASATPLSRKYLKLVVPFSHCLCTLYFFLHGGKSFAKCLLHSLVCELLRQQDALPLLRAIAFPGRAWDGGHVTRVAFAYGPGGGPVAVLRDEQDEPFPESNRYRAILEMLTELDDKNLVRSFILLVLKEFCAFHQSSDPSDARVFNVLLQELCEWNVDIGEALVSGISEVIGNLTNLLESICGSNLSATRYEKTLWVVSMILHSILESDEKLSSSDWSSMQQCLPSLQRLQQRPIDPDLKEVVFSVTAHIATRGAAGPGRPARADEGAFAAAMRHVKNPLVHIRGHGLIVLAELLRVRDAETLRHKAELFDLLQETLRDEESYVFLPSARCLSRLAEADAELVLPALLSKYRCAEDRALVLKVGEVLTKVCDSLGDMAYAYKDELLRTFLAGTKREDPQVRSSSLSNLGQACMALKFNVGGHWLQEILVCVHAFLKTDQDLEVRRSAVMVLYLLLKGVGEDMIQVLESELKGIYSELLLLARNPGADDVLRLHADLALREVDEAMRTLLRPGRDMRVLRP